MLSLLVRGGGGAEGGVAPVQRFGLDVPRLHIHALRTSPRCRIFAVDDDGTPEVEWKRLSLTDQQVEAIFREFDTSGDGFIELDELQVALEKAGKSVSRAETQEILNRLDENSDNKISLDEFKQLLKLAPSAVPDVFQGLFAALNEVGNQGLFAALNEVGNNALSALGADGQWRRTASGARFVDDVVGPGNPVLPGDFVSIHYTVTLLASNTVVETTRRGSPLGFPVGEPSGGVQGWNDAVEGMRIGGKRRVYVSPLEGEGQQARYDIEVIGVESSSYARREEIIASLGGRRSITRTLFALSFVPYFLPDSMTPSFFQPNDGRPVEMKEDVPEQKVDRADVYVAKSLDALFPPSN